MTFLLDFQGAAAAFSGENWCQKCQKVQKMIWGRCVDKSFWAGVAYNLPVHMECLPKHRSKNVPRKMSASGNSTRVRVRFAHAHTHGGAIGTNFGGVIFAMAFGQALHYGQIVSNSRSEQYVLRAPDYT